MARNRRNIDCHRGKTRALAIGQAVEDLEREGGGEVVVRHANEDRIVLLVTVELATAEERRDAVGAMFSAARDLVCALGVYEGGWNPAREQWAEVTQARDALAEALQPFFAALDEGSDR